MHITDNYDSTPIEAPVPYTSSLITIMNKSGRIIHEFDVLLDQKTRSKP